MKKTALYMTAVLFCLCFVGCGGGDDGSGDAGSASLGDCPFASSDFTNGPTYSSYTTFWLCSSEVGQSIYMFFEDGKGQGSLGETTWTRNGCSEVILKTLSDYEIPLKNFSYSASSDSLSFEGVYASPALPSQAPLTESVTCTRQTRDDSNTESQAMLGIFEKVTDLMFTCDFDDTVEMCDDGVNPFTNEVRIWLKKNPQSGSYVEVFDENTGGSSKLFDAAATPLSDSDLNAICFGDVNNCTYNSDDYLEYSAAFETSGSGWNCRSIVNWNILRSECTNGGSQCGLCYYSSH